MKPAFAAAALGLVAGCSFRQPVVADMTCPTGAELVVTRTSGACQLPGGTKNGPAYVVDPKTGQLVEAMVYDHDVLDGPYARYGDDGQRVVAGTYRGGKKDGLWSDWAADGSRVERDWVADAPIGAPRRFGADGEPERAAPPPVASAAPSAAPSATTLPQLPPPTPSSTRTTSDVDAMAAENAEETAATGVVVSPARVRLLRFEGDVAFDAQTVYQASTGGWASGFVGATVHAGVPFGRLSFKQDHYSGVFASVGVTGSFGESARADSCNGPCATNADIRWGERWLLGPYARLGYARSHDGRETGAVRSFAAYGGLALALGEDRWALLDNTRQSAFVWRARLSVGYTAPGLFPRLLHSFRDAKKGEDLFLALALAASLFFEHGELFVDVGGDRGVAVSGVGVQLGFGL